MYYELYQNLCHIAFARSKSLKLLEIQETLNYNNFLHTYQINTKVISIERNYLGLYIYNTILNFNKFIQLTIPNTLNLLKFTFLLHYTSICLFLL